MFWIIASLVSSRTSLLSISLCNSTFLFLLIFKLISSLSVSALRSSASHWYGLSALYPPPFDVVRYIQNYRPRFYTLHLSAQPSNWAYFVVLYGLGSRDTAAEACQNSWKHWGGRGTLQSSWCSTEMNSLFVRCRKKDSYRCRLSLLFTEVHPRAELPTVCSSDLLALSEDFWCLKYIANRSYCAREFYLKYRVRERQKPYGSWHNVELLSVRSLDRIKYYRLYPLWWTQFELPSLFFVSSSFLPAYDSDVTIQGLAADQTRIQTITVTQYNFKVVAIWIVIPMKERAPPTIKGIFCSNIRLVGFSLLFRANLLTLSRSSGCTGLSYTRGRT